MIEDNIVRARPEQALPSLKQKLNGYRRFGARIYIGITNNPERRWEQHRRKGGDWKKMVLLYEAYTVGIALDLEQDLIAYAQGCNFLLAPHNISPGGEAGMDAPGHRYLYVLVSN